MSLLDTASLIVTPNGYKEGKLYSVIPSDGSGDLSVTRATTATRVNSQGLVELVPYNLVQYSEQLDDSSWNKLNVTITPNSTTAPDGTLTADTMTNSSTGYGLWQQVSVAPSTEYTFSFYVKKGTNTSYIISVIDAVSFAGIASLDYSSQVGTEWVRVSTTFTTPSTTSFIRVYQMRDGSSTGTAFLWGAQLVEGSVAKDYQKTETRLNIPRLDYSNGTCPSILVEPQRTNLVTYSSSFDNAAWVKGAYNGIVANAIISPDGTQNADKIESISNSGGVRYTNQAISTIVGTYSIYMKAGELTQCLMYGAGDGIYWNLTDGSFIGYYAGGSNITSYSSEDVGNGWYRYTMTNTNGFSYAEIYMSVNQTLGTAIPSGQGFYLWGAQIEAGNYATSYIPTTSASVTRNADVMSKTGISSLIGQTEGTMFIDTYIDNIAAQTNDPVLFYVKGSVAEAYIEINDTGGVYGVFYDGSTSQGFIFANIGLTNGRHKMAFGYKNNDFVLYVDGVQVGTDTSGTVSGSLTEFGLQYYQDFYRGTQEVNASALWKTRLTNAQLATLTTI